MGIRINRDIGYFLEQEKVKDLLVDNFQNIIEKNENINHDVLKVIKEVSKTEFSDKNSFLLFNSQLKRYLKREDFNININEIVSVIRNGYSDAGVLFQTPELSKKSRYDDLIDFYDNMHNLILNVKYIKEPIYPDSFYVCIDVPVLTDESIEYLNENYPRRIPGQLTVGENLSISDFYMLNIEGEEYRDIENKEWTYPTDDKIKHFHPYINPIIYLIVKELKILKPGINYIDFIKNLEPAIVTSWR